MPRDWDRRWAEDREIVWAPEPLLVETAERLPPGRALDLACGAGRNALWLARLGWSVTAVDRSATAIRLLRDRSVGLAVEARVADLELREFAIEREAYDLICDFYYLQRDLFPEIRNGTRPGGAFVAAIHLEGSFALRPGELREEFAGWRILYYSEAAERGRRSARMIARRA